MVVAGLAPNKKGLFLFLLRQAPGHHTAGNAILPLTLCFDKFSRRLMLRCAAADCTLNPTRHPIR